MFTKKIRKRDGRVVDFDSSRIKDAIHRAFIAVELENGKRAGKVTEDVVKLLEKRFEERIPSVEDVQDIVTEALERSGYAKVAREYHAYKKKKEEIRKLRQRLGIEESKLTVNALEVLRKRYLLRDEEWNIMETPARMFMRVAKAIARVERKYGGSPEESENVFYEMMARVEFLPNSPTLFNAGTQLGQLSACFVLPVDDSLESIFTAVKNMALIEKSGGGVGFDFSKLRPKGDTVKSTKGVASGPVSFMRVFDSATEVIKAGGKRRGAMMGVLRADHPDIMEFITSKHEQGVLSNFNISVTVTDDFMRTLREDGEYWSISPRNKERVRKLKAKDVWKSMVKSAWQSGDPGVIFLDEINRHNPIPAVGRIEATNPCGEEPLLPYESCNLGSVNLSRMIENAGINWKKLRETVRNAVHFLDNVIDANSFPLKEIEEMTKANRKIGLGVMGFADMLIKLGVPYDSEEALKLAEKIMKLVTEEARKKSVELGEERGSFPNFNKSVWKDEYSTMRNATITTIAPTGSISIIAGCSSGIEPLFAVSFMRKVLEGTRLFEINPLFERTAKKRGFYCAELLEETARTGSVQRIKKVPEDVKRVFVTALDISPEWHVRMQAAFQKYTDNAVSKTVNLPYNATVGDVEKVFWLAHKLECKGITIYRYGSKPEQVLNIGEVRTKKKTFVAAESEYAGGCPTKTCPFPN
jgi:ribonucleoside-diphosphate reductase alpha chain